MSSDATPQIFVAIAAYRDVELAVTIQRCLEQAHDPSRINFGICLQHDRTGPPEVQPNCLDRLQANLRVSSHDWSESRGGCWARHIAQSFYAGEAYTMQIDSHMRLVENWDEVLIEMMGSLPAAKPLISGQCPLYDYEDGRDVPLNETDEVPTTVAREISDKGWIHHPSVPHAVDHVQPRRTRLISGMFVFTLGEWNVEVRQDPEHLYTGEELALSIRSFTWGYDLFNPDRIVAWHRHHPEGNVRYIGVADRAHVERRTMRSLGRLRTLERGDPDRLLGAYGPGPHRTVEEYARWAGFDFAAVSLDVAAQRGETPAAPQLSR